MTNERQGNMIVVLCDECKEKIDELFFDRYSTYDWVEFWRNPDNHLCPTCWVEKQKRIYKESKHSKKTNK